ncbi:MAG TPA: MaoC family dehydratase [bacterium]|nr:MaoC family dehydratase [bacterium]
MKAAGITRELTVGAEIAGPVRVMTAERIEWYDSAMLSAAKDELAKVGSNIHTDQAYAASQGLPGIIGDGMISTNWISTMLVDRFGMDYLERGELRTKFIRPVLLGATVSVRGRVTSVERRDDGSLAYALDVWCEDEQGTRLTDGDAKVEVRLRS